MVSLWLENFGERNLIYAASYVSRLVPVMCFGVYTGVLGCCAYCSTERYIVDTDCFRKSDVQVCMNWEMWRSER